MTSNPKAALSAILQGKMTFGKVSAYPLTIQRQALLEAIQSPFAGLSDDWSIENVTPSLFIFTQSAEQLDEFSVDDAKLLKAFAFDEFNRLNVTKDAFWLLYSHVVKQIKLIGDLTIGSSSVGKTSTNGWLVCIAEIACSSLYQDINSVIREIPLSQLLLMTMQWHRKQMMSIGKDTMTLEDKEAIDKLVEAERQAKKEQENDGRRSAQTQS